jgi:hypothetical protein
MEASAISCCKDIQDTNIGRQVNVEHFLGFSRAYFLDLPECGTAVTSATYCDMLQRGLKPAICSKRRGRPSEGILLLHDIVHPLIVTCMLGTLRKLKWEIMEHPAHSSDLVPYGFYLLGLLKEGGS